MLIIPAIDLRGGRCVRLWQGKEDRETVYSEDPLAVARMWIKKGAQRLHIVDLDGAFRGKSVHLDLVERIAQEVDVPIELGGGIREKTILDDVFGRGVDYAIIGTRALSFGFVKEVCLEFGDKIMVSVDIRKDKILAEGWKKESSVKTEKLLEGLVGLGVKTIIFTDTTRDGTLKGVNIRLIQEFLQAADVEVIIAGGIASLEDIKKLAGLNGRRPAGAIIGKALYDGRVKLEEALAVGVQ